MTGLTAQQKRCLEQIALARGELGLGPLADCLGKGRNGTLTTVLSLVRRGLVEREVVASSLGKRRVVYRLTAAGRVQFDALGSAFGA